MWTAADIHESKRWSIVVRGRASNELEREASASTSESDSISPRNSRLAEGTLKVKNLVEFTDGYIAVWSESDAERRGAMVRDLWTQDARQLLQPPIEIKDAATAIGMIPVLEIRGHEALERRISKAYERFVAPGIFVFRRRASPERIRDLVKLNWDIRSTPSGLCSANEPYRPTPALLMRMSIAIPALVRSAHS
jgi:hypothetical protein